MPEHEKVYVGCGKLIVGKFNDRLRIGFSERDLDAMRDHLDRGWVNVVFQERREPSATGNTHYGLIDEWKPPQRNEGNDPQPERRPAPPTARSDDQGESVSDDMPF